MHYRSYGKTGIQVSALGFGAMRVPTRDDGTADAEVAVPLLKRGLELGITYFDSAYGYTKGTSEVVLGQAIQGHDRSKLCIATKIGVQRPEDAPAGVWRGKLEECLRRLNTPYIDLMHFHNLSWTHFSEFVSKPGNALEAARKAQAEGLIRHLAFSSHDKVEGILQLIETGEFAGMLVQYNFLDRHNEPAIAAAGKRGMGVTVMGPIAGGRLAIPLGLLSDQPEIGALSTPEVALRFVWNNPDVTVALSGMTAIPQVEENVAAASRAAQLSVEELARVAELVKRNERLADLYCTGCGYCMPCPNQVNIPENFRYMNWQRVWGLTEQARKAYQALGPQGTWGPWAGRIQGLPASACVQCGECEPKCPQRIPIIKQLEEVAETLGQKE